MLAKSISGAAAAALPAYIEDVFSTYLYTGTGATQTITNGIDLSGKGGLVWIKGRSGATGHRFTDTARGATKSLASNSTAAEVTESTGLTAFGSTGFTIGDDADYNTSTATYVSWAFRKQPKFFDVLTFTTSATTNTNQRISHNLGSTPGMIIVKEINLSAWYVWHRSLSSATDSYLLLNQTAAAATFTNTWGTSAPSSTDFGINTNWFGTNTQYVAYLFAHDAGGFGLTGTDNVISCGSFTTDGSGNATVNLGYEPQFIIVKQSTGDPASWQMVDNMRGFVSGASASTSDDATLNPNNSNAEGTNNFGRPTATGFEYNGVASQTYIYIAIRRGPMKVPTSGTSVFSATTWVGDSSTTRTISNPNSFVIDGLLVSATNFGSGVDYFTSRLTSPGYLKTPTTGIETTSTTGVFPSNCLTNSQTSFIVGNSYVNTPTIDDVAWMFRRAPGFFDVVAYTGTGANRTVNHNLAAVPEMMIVKRRDSAANWWVYDTATGNTKYQVLNSTATPVTSSTAWNNTTPTSTVFTVGTGTPVNASAGTYIAYLFATCPGVSKVGSYTGTGTTKQIDCGFTGGARFVLIKRTDSTGDWYVWDTARGIVAGNDPYLLLNSESSQETGTDYIDTYSAGFEISSTAPAAINANGGTFIFLAIA